MSHNEATDVGGVMYSNQGNITIRNTSSLGTELQKEEPYTHTKATFLSVTLHLVKIQWTKEEVPGLWKTVKLIFKMSTLLQTLPKMEELSIQSTAT